MIASIDALLAQLAAQTAVADKNAGVRVGWELAKELKARGLLTSEPFGVLGVLQVERIDAYGKTHAIFPVHDMAPWDFQVGGFPLHRARI